MPNALLRSAGLALALTTGLDALAQAQPTTIAIEASATGKAISPDLFGIFFEDLNYAADGGLYAELVQNRSFEYEATEQLSWTPLTAWEHTTRDGGRGSLTIESAVPVHAKNPHYVVVETQQPGAGVGLLSSGFDGIAVQAGDSHARCVRTRQRVRFAVATDDVGPVSVGCHHLLRLELVLPL